MLLVALVVACIALVFAVIALATRPTYGEIPGLFAEYPALNARISELEKKLSGPSVITADGFVMQRKVDDLAQQVRELGRQVAIPRCKECGAEEKKVELPALKHGLEALEQRVRSLELQLGRHTASAPHPPQVSWAYVNGLGERVSRLEWERVSRLESVVNQPCCAHKPHKGKCK